MTLDPVRALCVLGVAIGASSTPCSAALVRFDFTGTITSTFGVEDAGTTVSGYYTFDPSAPNSSLGAHLGDYDQSAPAEFHLDTNGGFSLTQTTTFIQIEDKYLDGVVDGYRVDADTGSFSSSTLFDRLEISLSNNSNPFIEDIAVPTVPPDFASFQFHEVGFFEFDGNTATKRVLADITSLVPEPSSMLLAVVPGLALLGMRARRRSAVSRATSL